jgi:hypothetical protein
VSEAELRELLAPATPIWWSLRGNPLESIEATRSIESVWRDGVKVAGAL